MEKMKIVIFKDLGGYCTTSEENYNARIQDARRIQKWYDFKTPEEIIEYSIKYFGGSKEDYIVVEKGVEK